MSRQRKAIQGVNLLASVAFAAAVVYVSANGIGPLPPLGPAFNPGTGVWQTGADAQLPTSQALSIAGLDQPAKIVFDANGVAYIDAKSDHDLFLCQGYLHARFRLTQMDLMRRQGEGLLSEIVGEKALSSDKFELQLGLQRTAEAEWTAMAPGDPGRTALTAYTQGVNDVIREDERTGKWPVMCKLLGYQPKLWTPQDSLVIQGIMTQTLDFTDAPLDYALLSKSLGYDRTMSWFPILPTDEQHPYDPGPYQKDAPAPVLPSTEVSNAQWSAVLDIKQQLRALPDMAVHHGSNSNNWAVDGSKTASGKPLMAGDPHLSQTLPAIWYQVTANSPNLHFSGVSIPGLPLILIGHNNHISWSLTNVQNQATLFYAEKTDSEHPNQYYWNGAWHLMKQVTYNIPVKGKATVPLRVDMTVHGPIMTEKGQTMSVDWMGSIPTPGIDVLLQFAQASNYTDFRNSLKDWHAPAQNFVYADENGNIGLISAGYYPIVKSGNPWMPLSGTGESDVVGTIPFDDIPQVYDPPSHIVFTANQRVVGNDYPYYIGTTYDFFDNGYRADEIYQTLSKGQKLTTRDMELLQNDLRDHLATLIVPQLLAQLKDADLPSEEAQARTLLQSWNHQMDADSAAATIWWTFWNKYLSDTFNPWWQHFKVPTTLDTDLKLGPSQVSLNEDLEAWTLHDKTNAAFSLPDGTKRSASDVMLQAFHETVAQLSTQLDTQPNDWAWGRLHTREFTSLVQIPALGYGPLPSGGDNWTVDAADSSDGYLSTAGPSWRFIMDWGSHQGEGVYPGGQSENPLSSWYENLIPAWWNGSYYPMYTDSSKLPPSKQGEVWTVTSDGGQKG